MASGGRLRPAMDGDAGFPPAPLKIETQLEPGELTRTRAGPGFGVCNVYISRGRARSSDSAKKMVLTLRSPDGAMKAD